MPAIIICGDQRTFVVLTVPTPNMDWWSKSRPRGVKNLQIGLEVSRWRTDGPGAGDCVRSATSVAPLIRPATNRFLALMASACGQHFYDQF